MLAILSSWRDNAAGAALPIHLLIVCPYTEVGWLSTHLTQYSNDLAAVVGRVVNRLHKWHHSQHLIGFAAVGASQHLCGVHNGSDSDQSLPAAARVLAQGLEARKLS